MKRYCQSCRKTSDLHTNSRHKLKSGEIRTHYLCRTCSTARTQRYRKTPAGKSATRRASRKYDAAHKTRRNAWVRNQATRPKGLKCKVCKTDKRVWLVIPDMRSPSKTIPLCPLDAKKWYQRKSPTK